MSEIEKWDAVKTFYKNKFGIDEWLLELYVNLDILSLCVSGASNSSIQSLSELPLGEIKEILNITFKFDGWETELKINPWKLYKDVSGDEGEFRADAELWMDDDTVDTAFEICEIMATIEERIADEWV